MRRAGARPEAEEDDPSRGLIDGEDAPPRRRWRTRTSRMSSLHEPVPTGVYVGFASCVALFLALHFFNRWWFDLDEIP
jgi:hypothetical protein